MNKRKLILKLFLFSFVLGFIQPVFGQESAPEPYNDEEFPQSLKDLRRFEIISLGSLPFVTLDVTLTYSMLNWYKNRNQSQTQDGPNIFAVNTFTQEEQIKILKTSLGISIGVGLTDLFVNLGKRLYADYKTKEENKSVLIIPLEEDPDAIKLSVPMDSDDDVEIISDEYIEAAINDIPVEDDFYSNVEEVED